MSPRCFLRRRDGTLLDEIRQPSPTRRVELKRDGGGVGLTEIVVPLDDPGIARVKRLIPGDDWDLEETSPLLHDQPAGDKPFRDWSDTDLELAWYRDGVRVMSGPIVDVEHARGSLRVTAWTQEAYPHRSVIGSEHTNYFRLGSDPIAGHFDEDPSLTQWTSAGATASTTTSSTYLYTRPRSLLVQNGKLTATGQLDPSPNGNYAFVTAAVMIPSGVTPQGITSSGVEGDFIEGSDDAIGYVEVATSSNGMGWLWTTPPEDSYLLELPSNWTTDQWYYLSVQVPQPAGVYVRYRVNLLGGTGGSMAVGVVRLLRPANVGAEAGDPVSAVIAAIHEEQTVLLSGTWTRDTDTSTDELTGNVRYFLEDHEQVTSAVGDWEPYGDAWVDEMELRWGQRGQQVAEVVLTTESMGDGWSFGIDASEAVTELFAISEGVDATAPPEQVRSVDDAGANRLVDVVRAPAGISPRDLQNWADEMRLQMGPRRRLSAVPLLLSGSGVLLEQVGLGDWVRVRVTDGPLADGSVLDYEFEPVVDRMLWDPVTDEVEVEWVVGRKGRGDLAQMVGRMRREFSREQRRVRSLPQPPRLGRVRSVPDKVNSSGTSATNALTTDSMSLPEGAWVCRVTYKYTGTPAPSDIAAALNVSGSEVSRNTRPDPGANVEVVHTQVVYGPATVTGTGYLINRANNASTATTTLRAERVGA